MLDVLSLAAGFEELIPAHRTDTPHKIIAYTHIYIYKTGFWFAILVNCGFANSLAFLSLSHSLVASDPSLTRYVSYSLLLAVSTSYRSTPLQAP